MNKVLAFIDGTKPGPLLAIAILLALAPFSPEPHLVQKFKMLASGILVRPVDIFDLVLHGSGLLLCIFKFSRLAYLKKNRG